LTSFWYQSFVRCCYFCYNYNIDVKTRTLMWWRQAQSKTQLHLRKHRRVKRIAVEQSEANSEHYSIRHFKTLKTTHLQQECNGAVNQA